jgi:hypothetical protein
MGRRTPGLAATVVANHRYVYIWADGIYFNIRADERQCILVIIGVTDKGHKQLLGLDRGLSGVRVELETPVAATQRPGTEG